MILEHAILPVRPGEEPAFEAALDQARPLISSQPGFRNLVLSRSIESPNLYLLLVEWNSVEAHTEGFRVSAEYQDWKRLLHHFYEPFPTVEHFIAVSQVDRSPGRALIAAGHRRAARSSHGLGAAARRAAPDRVETLARVRGVPVAGLGGTAIERG